MPVLPTVVACTHCGRPTEIVLQSVEDSRLQHTLPMAELIKIHAALALCGKCRDRYNWLAAQGRSAEFATESPENILRPSGNWTLR